MIAAKNHKNGVANPYAQMRKDFGYEFCRAESEKNPFVAGALKRTECSPVSGGGAPPGVVGFRAPENKGQGGNNPPPPPPPDFLPTSEAGALAVHGCTLGVG